MSGDLPFSESLRLRLELVRPVLEDVRAFGNRAHQYVTDGMPGLIAGLVRAGHDVWIMSGGLFEAIEPVALKLGIPSSHIAAVRLQWNSDGSLSGIDPRDPFAVSKVMGARKLAASWPDTVVMIGDGATDLDLYEQGVVQYFIAFAQHQARPSVVSRAAQLAHNTDELRLMLEALI